MRESNRVGRPRPFNRETSVTSSFSKPLLLRPGAQPEPLERVPLSGPESSAEYSESWLQDLLYKFPECLPIAEIDGGFVDLIPVCREMNTPAGPVDVFYITSNGRPVIVEAKLWRNPEARRKVVGQILDYAKELSHWSYESLDAAVRAARDGTEGPKGLFDVARLKVPDLDEAQFIDSVFQSLRQGDLLLLIVGDGIREGVGAITQFLESHGTLHFTFGLVEMAIYRLPGGGQLVQPRVLAQSTIVRRIVVKLEGAGLAALEESETDGPAESDINEDLTQTREKFTRFWTEFLAKLDLDDKSQPVSKPSRSTNQYFKMPTSAAWVSAYLAQSLQEAGVYLTFNRGPIGDRLYAALKEDQEGIEAALKSPVFWKSDGAKHSISTTQSYPGILLVEHRNAAMAWLSEHVNAFITVFRPRIEKVLRESE